MANFKIGNLHAILEENFTDIDRFIRTYGLLIFIKINKNQTINFNKKKYAFLFKNI